MRQLTIFCCTLLLLGGCQKQVKTENVVATQPVYQQPAPLQVNSHPEWSQQLEEIIALSEEQAQLRLQSFGSKKPKEPEMLFRYALLNQQLKDRLGWIRARDSFRLLLTELELPVELQPLITLLLQHNQAMINANARYGRLLQALEQGQEEQQEMADSLLESRAEAAELSEKIRALTNLEKSMSQRRASTTETAEEAND